MGGVDVYAQCPGTAFAQVYGTKIRLMALTCEQGT